MVSNSTTQVSLRTPGPWECAKRGNSEDWIITGPLEGYTRGAEVRPIIGSFYNGLGLARAEANAHFIAGVPALVDAVKKLLQASDGLLPTSDWEWCSVCNSEHDTEADRDACPWLATSKILNEMEGRQEARDG